MNLEVAQQQLREQVNQHPEKLFGVFNAMLQMHREVKDLRVTDTRAALSRLDRIINQIHMLKQVTQGPSFGLKKHAKLMAHMNRIYQKCYEEREEIVLQAMSSAAACDEASGAEDRDVASGALESGALAQEERPLSDWAHETLQQPFVRQLLHAVAMPILHPTLASGVGANVLVSGPTMSGKTFAVRALRRYVQERCSRVEWHEWGAYRFMKEAEWRTAANNDDSGASGSASQGGLSAGGREDGPVASAGASATGDTWRVFVVDKVSAVDVVLWAQQPWFRSWCAALTASPRMIWITLLEDDQSMESHEGNAGTGSRGSGTGAAASRPGAATSDATGDAAAKRREVAFMHRLFPVRIQFKLPGVRTLYAYLQQLVRDRFGARRDRPAYVRLPIEDEAADLSRLATAMHRRRANFAAVRRSFESACERVGSMALQDNVAYEAESGVWLPRHSVRLERLSRYNYSLVYPLAHDCVELHLHDDAAAAPLAFWNAQLMDRVPSAELGRFANVFVSADTLDAESYRVVAHLDIVVDAFPHHMDCGWGRCVELALAYWFTAWVETARANASQHRLLQSMAGYENLCSWIARLDALETVMTMRDLAALPAKHLERWLAYEHRVGAHAHKPRDTRTAVRALAQNLCGERDELVPASSTFFVLYVEASGEGENDKAGGGDSDGDDDADDDGDDDDDDDASRRAEQRRYTISWHGKSSAAVLDGRYKDGVPGNLLADDMCTLLSQLLTAPDTDVATERCCQVVQVRTLRGYAYHIMTDRAPTEMPVLHASRGTAVRFLPRLRLLDCGAALPPDYALTNESDLDVLQDAFPNQYDDMYRDDEDTWKLRPLRAAEHLERLNEKYSREVKFYLTLYHGLLQLRRFQFSGFSAAARRALDDAVYEVRSHLDYLLLIVTEHDEKGHWGGAWSMSTNHRLQRQYHLAEGDPNAPITVDLATEWLERGIECHASPRLFETLLVLCATRCDGGDGAASRTRQLYAAWSAHRTGLHDCATRRVYVQSTIPRATWSASRAACHLMREDPRAMLDDVRWTSEYAARCKRSLYHAVMEHATHIGVATPRGDVAWHAFAAWGKTEDVLARTMRRRHELWSLIGEATREPHMLRALFALKTACSAAVPSWALFYAHLLAFPRLAVWEPPRAATAAAKSALESTPLHGTFVRATLARLLALQRFVHRHVYRSPSPVPGGAPPCPTEPVEGMTGAVRSVDRRRRVLTRDEVQGLCVYGLAAHHVADCFAASQNH